jgi:two-component sensor histidine kinase
MEWRGNGNVVDFQAFVLNVEEPDHRIANSLQLISSVLRLQLKDSQRNGQAVTRDHFGIMIEETIARVESVAMLHRLLSTGRDRESINLDQYLRIICDNIVLSLSFVGKVESTYLLSSGQVTSPDVAVSVGLIVTELLTNSIKYAHPTGVDGKIVVSSTLDGGRIMIEVEDDGVGLPVDCDPNSDGNLGLTLVRSMATKCGGTVDFDSTAIGLRVRLLLPEAGCRRQANSSP